MTRDSSIGSLTNEFQRLLETRERDWKRAEGRRERIEHAEKKAALEARVKAEKKERARRYHYKKVEAAIKLQARWRTKYYRGLWLQTIIGKQTGAAILIQEAWYLFRLRRHSRGVLRARRRRFEEHIAATRIEDSYRKFRQRCHAKGIMYALAHKRAEDLRSSIFLANSDACLSIQQVYRGYKGKLLALRQMDIKRERENLDRQAEEMKAKIDAELRRKGGAAANKQTKSMTPKKDLKGKTKGRKK